MRYIAPSSRLFWLGSLVIVLMVAVLAVRPGVASADVRQDSVSWDAPTVPSLDNRPPEIESRRYLDTVENRYDDEAGALVIRTQLFAPGRWGNDLGRIGLDLSAVCDGAQTVRTTYSSANRGVNPDQGEPYLVPESSASMQIDGYAGAAGGTLSFDGQAFTATFSHPALKSLDLRCVSIEGEDDGGGRSLGSGYEPFYLDGFAPLKLTTAAATKDFKKYLASDFPGLRKVYAKCANLWVDESKNTQNAECMAHFRVGKKYHYLSTTALVEDDNYFITYPAGPFHRTWTRKWRRAGPKCLRTGSFRPLHGVLYSNGAGCDARMADEIYHGVTGWHGTGTGSFLSITRYHCRKRGSTYSCSNRVGDAFRWTPARR
ncbi:MAG: hypothetical protein ABUM26_06090 [Solirubrobacterales bacterium]